MFVMFPQQPQQRSYDWTRISEKKTQKNRNVKENEFLYSHSEISTNLKLGYFTDTDSDMKIHIPELEGISFW